MEIVEIPLNKKKTVPSTFFVKLMTFIRNPVKYFDEIRAIKLDFLVKTYTFSIFDIKHISGSTNIFKRVTSFLYKRKILPSHYEFDIFLVLLTFKIIKLLHTQTMRAYMYMGILW